MKYILTTLTTVTLLLSCEVKERNMKIDRYDNRNIKSIKRYNDKNILSGEAIWFYRNGYVEQKVLFRHGIANGHAYYFYPSGALKSHRFWIAGKMNGYCADYFDDKVGLIQASLLLNDSGELVYRKVFDRSEKVLNVKGAK